jgi:AcrR family transcriptional regulator
MNYISDRRLEEKDRRRAEILDAAEKVAASEGIDAITMDQVARQARISRALLYVYFKDRDDLCMGIGERGLELLTTRFAAGAAVHATGLAQVQAIGRAYVTFAREFPVYFAALSQFHASVPEAGELEGNIASCLQAGNEVHGILVQSLQAGMQDGSIDRAAGKPAAIAMTLWGFMHGIIQISLTKELVLSQYGLGGDALVNQALHLATRSLETRS